MKKPAFLLAAVLCLTAAGGALGEKYETMPDIFRFRQVTAEETVGRATVRRAYPDSANDAVDADMRGLIDGMSADAVARTNTRLAVAVDTGASVFRTGESCMSFLTVSRAVRDDRQIDMAFDARAYDLSDGRRLSLTDLILPDGAAWRTLENAVRDTVEAYFPGETPDRAALDAACARGALENAAFTLTPARLVIHYRANAFYAGKRTILHVALPHGAWRDSMTALARRQTDCSRFKMIALTYDDGPNHILTERVMDALREYGANATFFGMGVYYTPCSDVICRQHDALFAVESHSYRHEYDINTETAAAWVDKSDALMSSIIGVGPSMMRAPGGDCGIYRRAKVMLPFIGWNLRSDDLNAKSAGQVTRRVLGLAQDGMVVLMHDLCRLSPSYTPQILEALEERGYLCVTVAEMYDLYGVPLILNEPYNGTETTAAAKRLSGESDPASPAGE